MKALLLHHPYVHPRFEQDFMGRIAQLQTFDVFAADLAALEEGRLEADCGPVHIADYDVIVVFVAFNRLRRAPALSWGGFRGLRVLMDHDIIQNYSDVFDASLKGAWLPEIRRHRFDHVVTSGGGVRDRLEADGLTADWLPKAVEPERFPVGVGPRNGIVSYGSAYTCRKIARRALDEAGAPPIRLGLTPYGKLGEALGGFLGCLAVSADLNTPHEDRASLDAQPATRVVMRPGLEPMAKLFEGASVGCCPVIDQMDDLDALGFRDGETALTFRTFSELAEKTVAALEDPDRMMGMGAAASRLIRERHTWAHRAKQLSDMLEQRLQA